MKRFKSRTIKEFKPVTLERTWGTETIVAATPVFTGKVLIYEKGHAGGLQAHKTKFEAFYLHDGEAIVEYDDGTGNLVAETMVPGMSFVIPPLSTHRFRATKRCVVFEVSTNVENDRRRMESAYGEPEPTDGLESTW